MTSLFFAVSVLHMLLRLTTDINGVCVCATPVYTSVSGGVQLAQGACQAAVQVLRPQSVTLWPKVTRRGKFAVVVIVAPGGAAGRVLEGLLHCL